MAERTQRLQRPPKRRRRRRRREAQLHLDGLRHGGRREGAGRPKTSSCVGHETRQALPHYVPVHVTLRVDRRLRLRSARLYRAVVRSIARAQGRFGMRVLHWSVQHGHLHLIVEATHRRSLSRGMQGPFDSHEQGAQQGAQAPAGHRLHRSVSRRTAPDAAAGSTRHGLRAQQPPTPSS